MRTSFVSLLFAFLVGCGGTHPSPKVDRVEIRLSGPTGLYVTVNSQGEGHYDYAPPMPESGSFTLTQQQFANFLQRLRLLRAQATQVPANGNWRSIYKECPKGSQVFGSPEAIWIHWVGERLDQVYFANLQCDPYRDFARQNEIFGMLRSLPIPGGDADRARWKPQQG